MKVGLKLRQGGAKTACRWGWDGDFCTRVLDKRPFDVIGVQLGLSYKGAAAVYYRAIRKLKKNIEGVNGYDI